MATPRHSKDVGLLLPEILKLLLVDEPLPEKNRDHALSGGWAGYRECHVKPPAVDLPQARCRHLAVGAAWFA